MRYIFRKNKWMEEQNQTQVIPAWVIYCADSYTFLEGATRQMFVVDWRDVVNGDGGVHFVKKEWCEEHSEELPDERTCESCGYYSGNDSEGFICDSGKSCND